jgi:hypothetical protein
MGAWQVFTARRGGRSIAASCRGHDGLLDCDSQPPNHRAQRRVVLLIVIVVAAIAVVAIVTGMAQGLFDMLAAFPRPSALFEADAWDHFFAGCGRLAVLGLIVAVVVVRWRIKRKRRPALRRDDG